MLRPESGEGFPARTELMAGRVPEATSRQFRGLIARDTTTDAAHKDLALALLDDARCSAAADQLLEIGVASLSEHYGPRFVTATVLLFGDPDVGDRLMRLFTTIPEPTEHLRRFAATHARGLLVGDKPPRGDGVTEVVGEAVESGFITVDEPVVTALIHRLPGLAFPAWPDPRWERTGLQLSSAVRAFVRCYQARPDVVVAVLQEGCVAPSADDVRCAGLGISTLLRNAEADAFLERLAGSVLDGINQRLSVDRRTDAATDALQTALSDCLRRAPASVAPMLLNTLRTADSWQTEALAKAFRLAPGPEVAADTEWTLMLLAFLGDEGVDSYARAEVADAASHATQNHPWLVHPHWRRAFDTLEVVWKQLEDNSSDFQLSLCVNRVGLISRIAASDAPDESLGDIERRLSFAGPRSLSGGELLSIAAGLAGDSLPRLTRVVPLLAAFLQPHVPGVIAAGAIDGCERLVRANAELLPNDLVDLLAARAATESDIAVYSLASLFGRAQFGSVTAARAAFDGFQARVRTWCSTQTPSMSHLQQALRALHNLAAQHESLRQPLFDVLVECSRTDVHEFDEILAALALAATRYEEFGDAYLTAWIEASRRRGFLAGLSGEWPYYDEAFKAAFHLDSGVVRAHVGQLAGLAVSRNEIPELATIAGLSLNVGAYTAAVAVLDARSRAFAARDRFGLWRPLALETEAYSLVVQVERDLSDGREAHVESLLHTARYRVRQAAAIQQELDARTAIGGDALDDRVHISFVDRADWLGAWVDFRIAWRQVLQEDDVAGEEVEWLRRASDGLPFGPDEEGRSCASIVSALIGAVSHVVAWDEAVRSATPDAAAQLQAVQATMARVIRQVGNLAGRRLPEGSATRFAELASAVASLSVASGPGPVLQMIAAIPLPVPLDSLPVERRRWPRRLPFRDRGASAGRNGRLAEEPAVARVEVLRSGRRVSSGPAVVRAGVIYDLAVDLHVAKQTGEAMVAIEASSTLPASLYKFAVDRVYLSRQQRRALTRAVLTFDRPQAVGSPPHEFKLVATLTLADGSIRNLSLFGDVDLEFSVGVLGQGEGRGIDQEAMLTDEEEAEFHAGGFRSRVRITVTGDTTARLSNIIFVDERTVTLTDANLLFFLRLIVGLVETQGGYLPNGMAKDSIGLAQEQAYVPSNVYQAVDRLRKELQPGFPDKAKDFLIQGNRGMLRVSTHPRFIAVDWERLAFHDNTIVRELAARLAAHRDRFGTFSG